MNEPHSGIPDRLLNRVELLCLDAGNTIVFLDHSAVAEAAQQCGFPIDASALEHAEGLAKRLRDRGPGAMAQPLPDQNIHPGWSALVRTMVQLAADLSPIASAECTRALWRVHDEFNLWRRLPPGLINALEELRATGVPVCVVSNSEGQLQALFERLRIDNAFDLVIDSHVLGIEKPDPKIFHHALRHFGIAPEQALHLGDTYSTDIVGARTAGVRAALIDPFGHYESCYPDVPRVSGATEVAQTLTASRRSFSSSNK